jgi:membrane associated rhomboid family serine protease
MGIYDRDYWQENRRPTAFGGMSMWSVTTWLIVINVAVFLINNVVQQTVVDNDGYVLGRIHPIDAYGYFSVAAAVYGLQIWRFITFQFLHANFNHILFNMIALFFFGPIVESYLGSRRYLAFYLLCGIAGPAMYVVLWALGFLIHDPRVPLVGASAGIFGILIAAAQIAPNATVLIYGIIPMRLRMMAMLLLAVAVYTTVTNGTNAGGEAAHLGGAAAGFLLIKNPRILSLLDFRKRSNMRIRQ